MELRQWRGLARGYAQPARFVAGYGKNYLSATGTIDSSGNVTTNNVSAKWDFTDLQAGRLYQVFTTWVPDAEAVIRRRTRWAATPWRCSAANTTRRSTSNTRRAKSLRLRTARDLLAEPGLVHGQRRRVVGDAGHDRRGAGQFVSADAVMLASAWTFTTPAGSFNYTTPAGSPPRSRISNGTGVEPGYLHPHRQVRHAGDFRHPRPPAPGVRPQPEPDALHMESRQRWERHDAQVDQDSGRAEVEFRLHQRQGNRDRFRRPRDRLYDQRRRPSDDGDLARSR